MTERLIRTLLSFTRDEPKGPADADRVASILFMLEPDVQTVTDVARLGPVGSELTIWTPGYSMPEGTRQALRAHVPLGISLAYSGAIGEPP